MSAALSIKTDLELALTLAHFRVEELPHGARRIRFIGEHTARNTEADVLEDLVSLARRAGCTAGVEHSGRGRVVWIGPLDPPEQEEPLNDVGHPEDCGCPACFPEAFDPAEQDAGRTEKGRI